MLLKFIGLVKKENKVWYGLIYLGLFFVRNSRLNNIVVCILVLIGCLNKIRWKEDVVEF